MVAPEVVYEVESKFKGLVDPNRKPDILFGGSPAQSLRLWNRPDVTAALEAEELLHHVTGPIPDSWLHIVLRGPVNSDGEKHKRLRNGIMTLLSKNALAHLETPLREHADYLLKHAGPEYDLADLAARHTWEAVSLLFDDRRLANDDNRKRFFTGLDKFGAAIMPIAIPRDRWFTSMIKGYVDRRINHPPDDPKPIDELLASDELELKEKEVITATAFFAALATTTAAINFAAYSAAHHLSQEDYERLRAENLYDQLYDESGRLYTPALVRMLKVEKGVHLAGFYVERGYVWVGWGAASRDLKVVTDGDREILPDDFWLDRTPNRHMGFSTGRHACPGPRFSRMMAVPLLEAVMQRPDPITVRRANIGGGMLALRVREMRVGPRSRHDLVV